uniref:Uncharacterized protein n=1 Tax=Seriola lalandi dorsalis TaxID=1841481 RepID=A0A3B4XHC1_SERLL
MSPVSAPYTHTHTHLRAGSKGVFPVCVSYFSLQVIYARRKYSVSPPTTAGPPEFERVFRAHNSFTEQIQHKHRG